MGSKSELRTSETTLFSDATSVFVREVTEAERGSYRQSQVIGLHLHGLVCGHTLKSFL